MKKVRASELVAGMAAAEEVTGADRMIKLLEKGAKLTKAEIALLRKWRVPFVTIGDEPAGALPEPGGVNRSESDFWAIYTDTITEIAAAFSKIQRMKEVPVIRMRELAGQRIALLVETIGAIEYLYKIRCHSDPTFHHSLNVAVIAGILGKWCGHRELGLKNLILAGLLHDVGKLAVPLEILEKPGPLSAEEFAVVKRHSQEGYRLIGGSGMVDESVRLSILQHHERQDGSGYPAGTPGDAICAEAGIIAVADTYDAMTSDRVYRRRVTPFEAMDEIAGEMFSKMAPAVCLAFLDHMRDRLTGCRVTLSNGQTAKIIGFAAGDKYFTRPVICSEGGDLLALPSGEIRITGFG